jgi:hypothetical protein
MKAQASSAQVQLRTEELLCIILDGATSWDARAFVREKEKEAGSLWELPEGAKPLSDSQIRRYMARADKMIAESCRASRKKLLRRHLAQRRNMYAKAISQGDIRTALAVARDEAELQGLYKPIRHEHTGKDGKPIESICKTIFFIPENGRDHGPTEPTPGDPPAAGTPDDLPSLPG